MWGIYGWGVTRGENAKTPPLLTGFSAVLNLGKNLLDVVAQDYQRVWVITLRVIHINIFSFSAALNFNYLAHVSGYSSTDRAPFLTERVVVGSNPTSQTTP